MHFTGSRTVMSCTEYSIEGESKERGEKGKGGKRVKRESKISPFSGAEHQREGGGERN